MEEIKLLVKQENGCVSFNFEEIKTKLSDQLAIYKNMIFTEESKKEAKDTVADLRNFKKSMSDRRIEIKKIFMQPYTDFEQKIKELDALIDEPIAFISEQLEEFERKRVEEKKQLINQIYEENISGYEEYLPLSSIYDSKWENVATSKKAIKDDITGRVETVQKDIDTINSFETDCKEKAIATYKRTLALSDAITYINNYEKQKAEILKREEEKKAQEEARQKENEMVSAQTAPTNAVEAYTTATVEPERIEEGKEAEKPSLNATVYEVKADAFQIAQLEAAMREFGISFRRM